MNKKQFLLASIFLVSLVSFTVLGSQAGKIYAQQWITCAWSGGTTTGICPAESTWYECQGPALICHYPGDVSPPPPPAPPPPAPPTDLCATYNCAAQGYGYACYGGNRQQPPSGCFRTDITRDPAYAVSTDTYCQACAGAPPPSPPPPTSPPSTRPPFTLVAMCSTVTPPPSPVPSGAWTQVQGRVHSNGIPPLKFYSIDLRVPLSKVFNLAKALISVRGDISVTPGTLGSPSPFPLVTQYEVNNTLDYAKLFARKPSEVQTLGTESITPPITGNGVYATQASADGGNHRIRSSWTITPGQYFIIYVEGNLNIENNITVQKGGFLAFIVKGHINIDRNVTNVDGIYYADGEICTSCDRFHTKQ